MERGLDTKSDSKQGEPGFLDRAENVVYETLKLLKKRNGYNQMTMDLTSGESVEDFIKFGKYKTELLGMSNTRLYGFSQSRDRWTEKGALYGVSTSTAIVQKNANDLTEVDGLVVDDFQVFTWTDDLGAVRYSVQDLTDKSFLVSNALVASGSERPVLARIQNDVFIVYGTSTSISYRSFNILEPATLTTAELVATNRDSSTGLIDAKTVGSRIIVAYNSNVVGTELRIFAIIDSTTTSSIVGVTGAKASHALDVHSDAQSRVIVSFSNGTNLRYVIYPPTLNASLLGPTLIEAADGAAPSLTLNLTNDITITSDTHQPTRNGDTVTLQVLAAAANPTNTVLVAFTGTIDAVTITITPNDGTNNAATPVGLTTAELVQLINTGLVTGKTITLTDASSLRADLNASGGGAQALADGGEGDGVSGTFAGGTNYPITTCSVVELSAGVYKIYYEVQQPDDEDNFVKSAQITVAGAVTSIAVFTRSVGLGARAFRYNDATYVPVVYESTVQSSYFLLDEDGAIVTKYENQTASGVVTYGVLPEVSSINETTLLFPALFKNRVRAENGTFFSTNGVSATAINMRPDAVFSNAEMADALHICAGVVRIYDGSSVTEHGFHVFPETLSLSGSAGSGGSMSDGSYGYVAVYKWTDNTGKDHRSAPTQLGLTVALSGGGTSQTASITVPTLRLTEKENVVIELYRTEASGTEYYRVTSDTSPTLNDKSVDSVTITDTISDTTLISRELLYTTGGVLENIPAPAASQICAYNGDRLVVIGQDGYRVFFSKETTEGGPVEFTDLIYRDVDASGGTLKTIKSMSDKLVAFTEDASFWTSGKGPTNTGTQDDLNKFEILSTDIGCINPDSVVRLPGGLMFKSRKGIWYITAGLQMQYTGDRVERFNEATVTAGDIVGELNQVRFLLSTDRALVYNYNLDKWATFENHGGLSSVVIGNDYYYLREDGVPYKEDRESFSDNTSPIKMRIETDWLSLVELQGIQRAYCAMILGEFKSNHKLRIRVAYNFIDAWVQEKLIDPLDFINNAAYGEESPYGSGTPYGGDGNLYEMRVDFKRQKCTAIKLLIEDSQEDVGEGLTLSAITIEAGAKTGTNKLGTARKFGTE